MMLSTPAETQSSQGSQQTTMPAAPCNSPSHGTLQKFVLFAHHKSVMNLLQVMLEEHFQKNNPSSVFLFPYRLTKLHHAWCLGFSYAATVIAAAQVCIKSWSLSGRILFVGTSKVPYVRIDGTTDHKSRQELQRRFHEDSSCNVRSLVACQHLLVALNHRLSH